MSDDYFASGHCLCGAVQFTVATAPILTGQCHCDHCQRASGTGHMSSAFFPEAAVTITGNTQSYASATDTGDTNTRYFCPICGSRLFGKTTMRPGVVGVAVGAFDKHDWFKPARIVYNKNKPVWDFMDPTVTAYEEGAPVPSTKA
jgi:hypothetical protein